jgi:hypothetical protein
MSNEKNKQFIASLKLEGEAELVQEEIIQAKKSKHLFLNHTDFNNSKKYREAIFARTYIPILLEIFGDYCTGVDEIETDIGTCFQINLNGGGKVYDYGSQVKVANGTDEEVKVAIRLALEKGWQGIHLTGSDEFKSKVFVEAVLSGAFPPEKSRVINLVMQILKSFAIANLH